MKKLLYILLFTNVVFAQSNYDSLITAGINQIYGIKFEQAEKTFAEVRTEFPNYPSGKFFPAMITWWQILLDINNEDLDNKFYDQLEETIDFCDDLLDENEENVDALFFKGGALGFRGRLLAIREDFFNAALDGKEALPLVYKVYDLDSTNIDAELGFGIYNYYASVIPEKYPFVKPFMAFFPEGDKELGLSQLKNTADNGQYAKIEAQYFMTTLYFLYEEDYETALKYAGMLVKQFPDNPIFERYLGRIQIKIGGYLSAVSFWKSMYKKCKLHKPGYNSQRLRESSYYIAMDYYLRAKYDSSMVYFEESYGLSKILDDDNQTGWLVNSTLFLGMLYDALGYRDGAIEKYKEVLNLDEYNGSYSKAEKYIKSPFKGEN